MKRKLVIFCSVEGFFELHSRAMEGRKDKKRVLKDNFLANCEKFKRVHYVTILFSFRTQDNGLVNCKNGLRINEVTVFGAISYMQKFLLRLYLYPFQYFRQSSR